MKLHARRGPTHGPLLLFYDPGQKGLPVLFHEGEPFAAERLTLWAGSYYANRLAVLREAYRKLIFIRQKSDRPTRRIAAFRPSAVKAGRLAGNLLPPPKDSLEVLA